MLLLHLETFSDWKDNIFQFCYCLLFPVTRTATYLNSVKLSSLINMHENSRMPPNVVVEWLTLLLRIRKVPGSNLARRPAILTEVFRGFPQSPGKCRDSTLN
jgi:hypothetical protein